MASPPFSPLGISSPSVNNSDDNDDNNNNHRNNGDITIMEAIRLYRIQHTSGMTIDR